MGPLSLVRKGIGLPLKCPFCLDPCGNIHCSWGGGIVEIEHKLIFLEEWFEDLVSNKKGTMDISHNYHSGTWVASYVDKRGDLVASSVDDEGNGQVDIISAMTVLKGELQGKILNEKE